MEISMEVSQKKKKYNYLMTLPYYCWGVYPKECESACNRGTCTPTFIAALFTIAKLWNQPRCPLTEE
jgi:hypothetical protein